VRVQLALGKIDANAATERAAPLTQSWPGSGSPSAEPRSG
jgi:hypothetical protein